MSQIVRCEHTHTHTPSLSRDCEKEKGGGEIMDVCEKGRVCEHACALKKVFVVFWLALVFVNNSLFQFKCL